MTLLFDGQSAFFKERGKTFAKSLVIHLPDEHALFFNGICYFPQNGAVHLPFHAVRKGENHLALRMNNRIFPTENLLFDGAAFAPAGLPTEQMLLRQTEELASVKDTLASLGKRLERLEAKAVARTLFS